MCSTFLPSQQQPTNTQPTTKHTTSKDPRLQTGTGILTFQKPEKQIRISATDILVDELGV